MNNLLLYGQYLIVWTSLYLYGQPLLLWTTSSCMDDASLYVWPLLVWTYFLLVWTSFYLYRRRPFTCMDDIFLYIQLFLINCSCMMTFLVWKPSTCIGNLSCMDHLSLYGQPFLAWMFFYLYGRPLFIDDIFLYGKLLLIWTTSSCINNTWTMSKTKQIFTLSSSLTIPVDTWWSSPSQFEASSVFPSICSAPPVAALPLADSNFSPS